MSVYRVFGVVFALACAFVVAYTKPEMAVAATCTHSLQQKINNAPAGSVVRAAPCIYRERVVVNKPLTLQGQAGSEIRGSNQWTRWTKSGNTWVSYNQLPVFPKQGSVRCEPNVDRCHWPAQVFVNGTPLVQVAASPGAGEFATSSGRKIILGESPSGKLVEISVRSQWVSAGANNVNVRGFTMKHAANVRELGAITNKAVSSAKYYSNWSISNNRLSDAHAAVVVLKGNDNDLTGNTITRGGQMGVHGGGTGTVISNNDISNNNTEYYHRNWEAGGVKFGNSSDILMEGNRVHNNLGPGLWSDSDATGMVFRNNRLSYNGRSGILVEATSGAEVYGNVVWENGWIESNSPWTPGIGVSASKNTRVYNNTVAWNAAGISVINMNRDDPRHEVVQNVQVNNNRIISSPGTAGLWWIKQDGWSAGTIGNSGANNTGYNNRYWYGTQEGARSVDGGKARFRWSQGNLDTLPSFNGTPGESNGAYMDQTTKNSALSSAGIPSYPVSR